MMVKPETSDPLPPEEIIKRIEKALKRSGGTHTWTDVAEGLVRGDFQIFWNDHGVAITEIQQTPQCRYLNVFMVAGRLPGVLDLEEQVERFALTQSCKFMTTSGRMGWGDLPKAVGWKPSRVVYTKEVKGF